MTGHESLCALTDRLRGFAELIDDSARQAAADPDRFPNSSVALSQRTARMVADDLPALLDEWDKLRVLATNARNAAAAPDYDEEAIREALWALAEAVR